jgi:peptidylprolyl isomerase
MKQSVLILLLAASTVAASAQPAPTPATNPAKPAVTTAKPATPAAKPATTAATSPKPSAPAAKPATTAAKPAATVAAKLPFGVPVPGIPAVKTAKNTLFSLRYQEIEIGKGAVAEPNKMYKVHYTGWLGANGRADDGRKFDSSYDHPGPPMKDKEGKPVMGDDGKPKLESPQPLPFPQGYRQAITGFDQGFYGMKIGGKRRIFVPWQLAYGAMGRPGPDADHPGIPPNSDLIFDVYLLEVNELPMPANHPPMGGMRPMGGGRPMPGAPTQPGASPAPATAPKPPAPATPAATSAPNTAPAPAPAPAAPAATTPVPPPPQPK